MNKLLLKFLSPSKEELEQPLKPTVEVKNLTTIQKEIVRLVKKGSSSKEISLITGSSLDRIHKERKALMQTMECHTMYDVMQKLEKYKLS